MPKFASRVRVQSEVCFGLKVTARYILAATVIYINNQTTKDKFKIILCSWGKDFCSFNKKQRKFHSYSEDDAVLFYIKLLHFSSRLLTEYFRRALKKLKAHFVSFVSFAVLLLV